MRLRLIPTFVMSLTLHSVAVTAVVLATLPTEREPGLVVELVGDGPREASPDDDGAAGHADQPSGAAPAFGAAAAAPSTPSAPGAAAEIAQLTTERDELAARLATETDARARLGDEVAALGEAVAALDDEVAALGAENHALARTLDAERRRVASLEQALAAERAAAEGALREQQQTYDALLAALREEITGKDVALRRARDGLAVSIVDRVLFPSGEASLSPEGREVIDKVARVLTSTAASRVVIEGHTDDVPIGPVLRERFPSNWELSSARATEVVRHLVARGVSPGALEAIGRADTRPVASNDTESGRRRNRRIEIVLRGSTRLPDHGPEPDA